MTTSTQFVQQAASHIGYTESPAGSNCNQFSHSLGRPCEPWCADFLVSIARAMGVHLPSESAYTPTMWKAFQTSGRTATVPKTGAFAFFHFPGESAGVDHVGVVETWTASAVTTIDGNTSNGGSQVNGGAVERRTRSRNLVVGYGIPTYGTSTPPPSGVTVGETYEVDMQITNVNVTIATDNDGNGWQKVPYNVERIVGVLGPGIRPAADGHYLAAEVGFTPEDTGTVVSVTDWTANASCVVRLRVAA